MNEHDSERLSGLLESDGMTNVESVADADVVVINTCCIRENADDKFFGTLSELKNWKTEKEDHQILVAGCLAQKDRELIREKAPYVDVVIGTHNVHRAAELRMRMENHADWGALDLGLGITAFDASGRTGKNYFRHSHSGSRSAKKRDQVQKRKNIPCFILT